jgi:type I restriction enzyme S subunit
MRDWNWDIPGHWKWETLGNIASWASGGTPKATEQKYYGGGIPWLVIGDLNDGIVTSSAKTITESGLQHSSAKYVEPGSIMVAMYGSIGKLGIAGIRCTTNQAIAFTRATKDELEPKYLFHYLASVRDILLAEGKGGAQANISQTVLKATPFCYPPREEQRRIANKLDHISARINDAKARLDTIPTILKRFRMSVLAAACSGRLTSEWRQSSQLVTDGAAWIRSVVDGRKARQAKKRLKTQGKGDRVARLLDIPDPMIAANDLPLSWSACQLATLFSVETGGTPSRKNEAYWRGGTIPWVKTGQVQNCDIFDAEERITQLGLANSNARVFPPETLLIAMYGEGKTRGQVGRLKISAATNQACAALVNESLDETARNYVYHACVGQYQKLREEAAGGNQPNLNLEKIREWVIAVPPPDEQAEIVRRVDALFKQADAIDTRYRKAHAFTNKLMPSVLAKAFRGQLVESNKEGVPEAQVNL